MSHGHHGGNFGSSSAGNFGGEHHHHGGNFGGGSAGNFGGGHHHHDGNFGGPPHHHHHGWPERRFEHRLERDMFWGMFAAPFFWRRRPYGPAYYRPRYRYYRRSGCSLTALFCVVLLAFLAVHLWWLIIPLVLLAVVAMIFGGLSLRSRSYPQNPQYPQYPPNQQYNQYNQPYPPNAPYQQGPGQYYPPNNNGYPPYQP
jgi:Fatty acid desaturase.